MAGRYLFDTLAHVGATSIGEPGSRLFYLIVGRDDGWVRMWLEKEQLRALGDGLDALLRQVGGGGRARDANAAPPPDAPMVGEFRVVRMAVGYDEVQGLVVFTAHDESDTDDSPTLVGRFTREQAAHLAAQAIDVCEAGRPLCAMCGEPIDPDGHFCPRANGHHPTGL
ncbi:MAG TPA: DUF3090 family protein [Dehalococcoidia bacterium]|nr:DUF3090 family protein [Dehalococcoidia bacterium]